MAFIPLINALIGPVTNSLSSTWQLAQNPTIFNSLSNVVQQQLAKMQIAEAIMTAFPTEEEKKKAKDKEDAEKKAFANEIAKQIIANIKPQQSPEKSQEQNQNKQLAEEIAALVLEKLKLQQNGSQTSSGSQQKTEQALKSSQEGVPQPPQKNPPAPIKSKL